MSSLPFPVALLALSFALPPGVAAERPDVVVADFEAADYGDWTTTGEAFGDGPAAGTLPGQMSVDGFEGQRLVNSFHGGDGAVGTLTSPPFELSRNHLNLLVGGGGYEGETCVNLRIDGKVVRTAVGPNLRPGGSERLLPRTWDVSELTGRSARIEIVDARRGGWGHVNVDQIVLSDTAADVPPPPVTLERPLLVDGSHLLVPIANPGAGGETVRLGLFDGDRAVQTFNVSLPLDGEPNWTAAYPLEPFDVAGRRLTLKTAGEPVDPRLAAAFEAIAVGPESQALEPADWTRPYRNAFHLAPRRGWNNDPNGLVYHDGLWHVFYQYNPFGIEWGNMHWGHYTSPDLTTWTERPIALFQNGPGDAMFSGGGFVDEKNTAGLGAGRLFVAFTSTGRGECLAHSADGATFTELPENPVVKHSGRDPKIFWHAPTERWVMAVYEQVETAETRAVPAAVGDDGKPILPNAQVAFYRSANLREWERTGAFTHPDRTSVFECPELFELPVLKNGEPTGETHWVLYGAQNRYFLGTFDGATFASDSGPHGDAHGAFYAAQTFENAPGGRRIQIGWLRTALYLDRFPDQSVNQCLSLPHELSLHATPDGPRLRFTPVAEVKNLRTDLRAEGENLSAEQAAELLTAAAAAPSETIVTFAEAGRQARRLIDGVDASFEGTSARIFTDRTVTEIYADDGRRYVVRTRPEAAFEDAGSAVASGERVASLRVYALKSIWPPVAAESPVEPAVESAEGPTVE